ncbi:M56 family metallopeptidase [Flavitalea sp. BT771]|uniref:M56 family metallopeptidase n=1 Tax=Flavitalea sp. BT771 TaxID=3063329 RepID=UPI0026E14EB9|nr:M56 family metallopeptidase [Flavitalea sp. BT771]MDO6434998.1 M56 family metallopeptidase [Flavitalea sp. BT771]MDV6223898.1 M56 family metallopeptidase [Flavitalea sp. BT771]
MIQAICWTLVHSLWQGLLFAMATGVVMLLTQRSSAAIRYNIMCGLFLLFLLACAGTFLYERGVTGEAVAPGAVVFVGGAREWTVALAGYCSEHAVPIVWAWLFVFMVKSLRMLGSLLYTQRLRHYGISAAPAGWQQKVEDLSRQLGIRKVVKLVESRIVKMPLVAGHWRPVIFMPLGLLTGLPEGEIEAVLLHELAHIRRNDYLINFLQHVAGNLLFFNPGFLWMSALLRDERENCCDDIAIACTRDRVQFIRALIDFKEYDLRMAQLATAFPARKSQLLRRVSRIAHNTNKTLDTTEKIFLVMSFAVVSLLVAAADRSPGRALAAQMPRGTNRVIVGTPAAVPGHEVTIDEKEPAEEMERRAVNKKRPVRKTIPLQAAVIVARETQVQQLDEDRQQARDQAARDAEQIVMNKAQAERDAQQAIRDREQAERDKAQADRDQHQAELDAEQAIRDKLQAERDVHQAMLDRQQAAKDAAGVNPVQPKAPHQATSARRATYAEQVTDTHRGY